YGFTVDEGIGFYASATAGPCLVPVYRLLSPVTYRHLLTASSSERDLLKSQGWTDEGIRFYAAAP
ncbi:MAG TPA: metallophosphoesterase, partial [Cystobacter sp.]